MPGYDGQYNADDPLVAPWFIAGWTAQNAAADTVAVIPSLFTPAGFPSNLSFVTLTASFFDSNGSGAGGFLTLMMSDGITVQDDGAYYRLPQRLTGTENWRTGYAWQNWGNGVLYLRRGVLDIEVFATDQTASGSAITTDSGAPLTYWVTEHMLGGRTYQITVPGSAAPGPVDINSLIIPGSVTPYAYDPVNPMGNLLIPAAVPAAGTTVTDSDLDGGTARGSGPGVIYDGGTA